MAQQDYVIVDAPMEVKAHINRSDPALIDENG